MLSLERCKMCEPCRYRQDEFWKLQISRFDWRRYHPSGQKFLSADHFDSRKLRLEVLELQVLVPEVVAPLRDAVGFVQNETGQLAAPEAPLQHLLWGEFEYLLSPTPYPQHEPHLRAHRSLWNQTWSLQAASIRSRRNVQNLDIAKVWESENSEGVRVWVHSTSFFSLLSPQYFIN